ncbi:hypothetical protein LJD42_27540, partial [Escherichia coli]|nr:hypothetical protein [Escherichia coli]
CRHVQGRRHQPSACSYIARAAVPPNRKPPSINPEKPIDPTAVKNTARGARPDHITENASPPNKPGTSVS